MVLIKSISQREMDLSVSKFNSCLKRSERKRFHCCVFRVMVQHPLILKWKPVFMYCLRCIWNKKQITLLRENDKWKAGETFDTIRKHDSINCRPLSCIDCNGVILELNRKAHGELEFFQSTKFSALPTRNIKLDSTWIQSVWLNQRRILWASSACPSKSRARFTF